MRTILHSLFLFVLSGLASTQLFAQMLNDEAFLKGNYFEIGLNGCGALGTIQTAPSGFHNTTPGLGIVADPDKDGWQTGNPTYFGDYFLPGIPMEGWALQVNGTTYFNSQLCQYLSLIHI